MNKVFFVEKLSSVPGIILLVCFGVIIAVGTAYVGVAFGGMLMAVVFALPVLYCIVFYPKFGIILLLSLAYMLATISSFVPIPVGTLMDGLQALLLLGLLIQIKFYGGGEIFKNQITTVLMIWIVYNVVEVANPSASSRLAWVYTIRTVATVGLTYYVYMYNVRTVKFIRTILILWIGFSIALALYAFKQEFIGFTASEEAYLHSDPAIAGLLFIAGHWRKFSFLSDPVVFAYNMVMPSILCICIIDGKFKRWLKIGAGALIVLFFVAALFSGTRGANVLLPAALLLFFIIRFNKKVLVFGLIAACFFVVLINIPTSNGNLQRFQTAFSPNNDDSYNVRKMNQKRIQPFILTHIMGGGLGATGTWGKRFSPGTLLANFPPDSGYIRVAVEDGWLGLLIFCTMMFVFIKTGINNYFRMQDPELKSYCLTMTLVVFTYNIANFPQEALVQFPSNIFFYLEVALINITYQLDQELTRKKELELTTKSAAL